MTDLLQIVYVGRLGRNNFFEKQKFDAFFRRLLNDVGNVFIFDTDQRLIIFVQHQSVQFV